MSVVLPEKGAYIDFGEAEDAVEPETIERFEALAGKHHAILAGLN